MLVLTRKIGQSIVVGDGIEVFILQVKGAADQAQVRVGIEAPRGVKVLRKEVLEEVAQENRLASQGDISSLTRLEELQRR